MLLDEKVSQRGLCGPRMFSCFRVIRRPQGKPRNRSNMALDEAAKTALFNALAWIESAKSDGNVDTENIDVGVQCLTEAFGLKLQDASQKSAYEVVGSATFPEIFAAGMAALGVATKGVDDDSFENDPAITKNPALWKKWVAKLEDKGFFNGAPLGSDEYNSRIKKALAKYKERVADAKPAAPSLSKEEREKLAEEAKAKGNSALNGGDYETAAKLYREALSHSSDGPSSHIYYANLAAADMYLGRYTEVIDNCEKAIALKPSYVKAYSRMGNAQVHLKEYDDAIDSFRRGLEVDSSNAACRDGLADAERKQRQQSAPTVRGGASAPSAGAGGAGGMPDLSSLAGMFGGGGGGGGLADLLSNPAMQQMAASMMQNPAMMQMAQNMMQNPDALAGMMGNLGGGGGGAPAGGMPDMAGMADAFRNSPDLMAARSDPELQEFFRDVDQNGPSAAMRHMSNPKVSQLLQNAMARMQG